MLKDTLISEIQKYIDNNGGVASGYGWYIGGTADPRHRLFREHNVNETNGPWIYGAVSSDREAREIEDHFLVKGCRGGACGGDSDAVFVYAYRINLHTNEGRPMESPSGIKHNLQPHEENSHPVSEGELDLLASFNFTASLVAGIGMVLAGIAIPAALDVKSPWTVAKWVEVFGCSALAIGLFIWSYREVTLGKSLLRRIKCKPEPECNGNV